MGVKLKLAFGVTLGVLILVAASCCFPKLMVRVAVVYGVLFVIMAVWFVWGLIRTGVRKKEGKQPCG